MKKLTKEQLVEFLEATLEEVKAGASFEGRIEYSCLGESCGPGEFLVEAFVRTGNDQGQGGAMIVSET